MNEIQMAAEILDQGGVVGMPTETVYGLAARIDRPEGLQKIFSTKERPFFDPLIVHVSSIEQAQGLALEWTEAMQVLADTFWPGPLTIVVKKQEHVSSVITSGLSTVGIRWPSHPVAQNLIETVGVPLAAPSANRFGRTSPTTKSHVMAEFGEAVKVLEGGASLVGIESTIVSADKRVLTLLRPGQISKDQINDAFQAAGMGISWNPSAPRVLAPGQMKHHYMPDRPLVILPRKIQELNLIQLVSKKIHELPDVIENVQIRKPRQIQKIQWLSLPPEPAQAARALYQVLRDSSLKESDVLALVWEDEKRQGPWEAIWDRLHKAASLVLSEDEV